MLHLSKRVAIPDCELELSAVRAQGPGGQNVNKVATGVHLRFDILASSLPAAYKDRLMRLKDRRLTQEGVIVIKAQQYRSQDQNRDAALERLRQLILSAMVLPKRRKPTRTTRASRERRLDQKRKRSQTKTLRRKVFE